MYPISGLDKERINGCSQKKRNAAYSTPVSWLHEHSLVPTHLLHNLLLLYVSTVLVPHDIAGALKNRKRIIPNTRAIIIPLARCSGTLERSLAIDRPGLILLFPHSIDGDAIPSPENLVILLFINYTSPIRVHI